MLRNNNRYPVCFFTVADDMDSLKQTSINIGFSKVEEMFEWSLKESGFQCEVTFSEKWGQILVMAKGDYNDSIPNDLVFQHSCEMFGIRYGQYDCSYYKKG